MGVGLLRPGVTEPEAQAEFDAIASRLESQSPATNRNRGARVTSVREQYSRFYRPVLGVLLASVGFLLLIACANVASLLLARATERDREMAIRAALGATRWQIVRQLLAESLALAVFAGATGVAAALFLVPLARTLLPMKLPIPLPGVDRIAISTPVLLFSSVLSMVTVLLFGLAPALRSATSAMGARRPLPESRSGASWMPSWSPNWRWRCSCSPARDWACAACTLCITEPAFEWTTCSRFEPPRPDCRRRGWCVSTRMCSAGCAFCPGCGQRRWHTVSRAEGAMDEARYSPKTAARTRPMPYRPWSTR